MSAKQSSPGLLCRCIRCHGLFKLYSHHVENNTAYSEFDCDCGRVIKVEEQKTHSTVITDRPCVVQSPAKEVQM